MSSVLDRSALEHSPLADLHLLANELGVDGFRRLRKAELIDAIIARQSGDDGAPPRSERRRRPRRRRARGRAPSPQAERRAPRTSPQPRATRRRDGRRRPRRGRRDGARPRGRAAAAARKARPTTTPATSRAEAERTQSRASSSCSPTAPASSASIPPETTDDDVYISAAQVKRCELVSGDRVAGPVRAPRRSERFPSLVRVDTINGRPADEVAEGTRFDDLPVALPDRAPRARLRGRDAQGDRVADAVRQGLARADRGAGRAPARPRRCARIADALGATRGPRAVVVLAGVRPGGGRRWTEPAPAAASPSPRRPTRRPRRSSRRSSRAAASRPAAATPSCWSTRSRHLRRPRPAARSAAARNIADGGSLTVIATGAGAARRRDDVITLDAALTALRPLPGARPRRSRDAAPGAAGRRRGRRGDRQGARRGGRQTRTEARPPRSATPAQRGVYATRPQLGSGDSSIGSSSRSGCT